GSPSMNFLPGVVTAGDGGPRIAGENDMVLPARAGAEAIGRKVEVGLRPEHLAIEDRPDALPLTVSVVEPTGSETHVYGTVGSVEVRGVFRERIAAKPGAVLPVVADPDRTHLFDAESGLRL